MEWLLVARAKRTLAENVMCAGQAGNDSLIKPQMKDRTIMQQPSA
jgi:hypothetical protein